MVTIQSLRRFVTRHPLVAYFGMAFAFTWILQIPLVLAQNGFGLIPFTLPTNLFTVPAVIAGPTLAAFVVTAATEGRAGVRQLLRRYLHWRVGIQWYLLVLFSYPLLLLVATSVALGQSPLHLLQQLWPLIVSVFLPAFVSILATAQLWEEVGWRGFALPHLQRGLGPMRGSLVLGVLHGLWHLPGFFYVGTVVIEESQVGMSIPLFLTVMLSAVVVSIILTWVYNRTQGSVLMCTIFHTIVNAANRPFLELVPGPMVARYSAVASLGLLLATLLLIVVTRGRLGYQPDQPLQPANTSQGVDLPVAQA